MKVIKALPELTEFSVELSFGALAPAGENGRIEFLLDTRRKTFSLPSRIIALEKGLKPWKPAPGGGIAKLKQERGDVLTGMTNKELGEVLDGMKASIDGLADPIAKAWLGPLSDLQAYLAEMEASDLDSGSMRGGSTAAESAE